MSTATSIPIINTGEGQDDPVLGVWSGEDRQDFARLREALCSINNPLYIFKDIDCLKISQSGQVQMGHHSGLQNGSPLLGYCSPMDLKFLGDPGFCDDHGINYPYMTGAMANGIASTNLVIAVARAGMLASFGAAGLSVGQVEEALVELKRELKDLPYCANLIHSPNEKGKEDQIVDLFIKHGLHLVEASAYLALTPAVVRYRIHGIHSDAQGNIITPNRIIAKASRIEVASRWLNPPPDKILNKLLDDGVISQEQMNLAQQIPMAQDLTVEADSGGHTDNRPAITLIPTMIALRDRLQGQHNYSHTIRIGAAGGIATPKSAAGAFAMGAAYIVTGTINQACVESGSSDLVRKMLSEAQQADIAMAPAVDMFEMGVKLQVLKRGTLFAMRGNKLYEAYRNYNSIDEIPEKEKEQMEKVIFKAPLSEIWDSTREFFNENDPQQLAKAEQDPKHKMALMFRWYLGLSSRWANAGTPERQTDYQVWCGPAMGAFNEWSKGSFLESPENRGVVIVALNIIFGAAITARINTLHNQGLHLSADNTNMPPLTLTDIENYLSE
jgi:trans-AT polyketide synthase/acyltransferase/oxidoreductase domain-containing protein